jgi:Flp pilus assembly protein TadG
MIRLLPRVRRRERGSAAVEFAILLPTVLIPLLAGALFFGRFFWHYTVASKAAHDAARFVALASPTELRTQCRIAIYSDSCVSMAALNIVSKEVAELSPGNENVPDVVINCDGTKCPTTSMPANLPKVISVKVDMDVDDPFLAPFTSLFRSDGGPMKVFIHATARSYYAGAN